jgi:FtsH-binding integral membrane protein
VPGGHVVEEHKPPRAREAKDDESVGRPLAVAGCTEVEDQTDKVGMPDDAPDSLAVIASYNSGNRFHRMFATGVARYPSRKENLMSYSDNPYRAGMGFFAAQAAVDERSDFLTKTYLHLAGAIGLFVILEAVLLRVPGISNLVELMIGTRYGWLAVLGLFMLVSYVAENWAQSAISSTTQYLGLGLYVLAEAVIFVPLLYIVGAIDPGIIPTAAIATVGLFAGMTAVVFITRKDFSFLRGVLLFGGLAAMGLIVVAILFQFALGPIFTYAMIALSCGYILYHTSNVVHHYRIGQHVAAALALFASVALLFWYILQLLLSRRN